MEGTNGAAKERKERLRRRLVAARVLAGLGQKELAEKIQAMGYQRGYSARTIGDMERGETPIQPQSIPVLAEACGLPPEFFTADFALLAQPAKDDQLDELRERLTTLEQSLEDAERQRQEDLASIAEELGRQVSLALETGVLPTSESGAATERRAANG